MEVAVKNRCEPWTAQYRHEDMAELLEFVENYCQNWDGPNIGLVVKPWLSLMTEDSCDLPAQVKHRILNFFQYLVTHKKKDLIRRNLIKPILNTVFVLTSTTAANPRKDVYDVDITTVAFGTLVAMATTLSPRKVIKPTCLYIETSLRSKEPEARIGACMAVANIFKAMPDSIPSKYCKQLVLDVGKAIQDPQLPVRSAALLALCRALQRLKAVVLEQADEIVPVLLTHLNNLCRDKVVYDAEQQTHDERLFEVLEMFINSMNDRLRIYLPELIDRLLIVFHSSNCSLKLRWLAIVAIEETASVAQGELVPCIPKILDSLRVFWGQKRSGDTNSLQVRSIVTLLSLADLLTKENASPLEKVQMFSQILQVAMRMIEETEHVEQRKILHDQLTDLCSCVEKKTNDVLIQTAAMCLYH